MHGHLLARGLALRLGLTAVVCAALAALPARAGIEEAGTTAANFLSLAGGAREAALAGASLGWSEDIGAASTNPAALGWLALTQFAAAHAPLTDGASQDWVGVGGRVGRGGLRVGFTALYHSLGSFEGRDALNQPTGQFSASDMALGLQVAQQVGDAASFGLTAKHVREDLGQATGSGFTFDLGAQVRKGIVGAGIAAQNIGGSMSYSGSSYPFPSSYGGGVSVSVPQAGLRFVLDGNLPRAYHSDVRAGVEWGWRDMAALRMGYRRELGGASDDPLGGPSFGLGAGRNGFWVDYAFDPGPSDNEQRLTLRFTPGQWSRAAGPIGMTAPEPAPAPAKPSAPKMEKAPEPRVTRAAAAPPIKIVEPPATKAPEGPAVPPAPKTPEAPIVKTAPVPVIQAPVAPTTNAQESPALKTPTAPAAKPSAPAEPKKAVPASLAPAVPQAAKTSEPLETQEREPPPAPRPAPAKAEEPRPPKVEDQPAKKADEPQAEKVEKSEPKKGKDAEPKKVEEPKKKKEKKKRDNAYTDAEREAAARAGVKLPDYRK